MSKVYLFAFGAAAGLALLGADYATQMKKAGPGFTPARYVETWSSRQSQAAARQARNERQAANPRDHLGAAPEGWARQEWRPAVAAEVDPSGAMDDPDKRFLGHLRHLEQTERDSPEAEAFQRRMQHSTQVYQKDGETVILSARTADQKDGAVDGSLPPMATTAGDTGFAVVDGVVFVEKSGDWSDAEIAGDIRPRKIVAQIGDRILLDIRAHASDESIRQILASIDYEALNLMLDRPLKGIGSDAPRLTVDQQRFAADQVVQTMRRDIPDVGHRLVGLDASALTPAMTGLLGGLTESARSILSAPVNSVVKMAASVTDTGEKPEVKVNRFGKVTRKASVTCGEGLFCAVDQ